MKYILVQWVHSHPDEPIWIYSELDNDNYEQRKVEVYADGRIDYASHTEATGTTKLSMEALPPFDEVAADPQFILTEITRQKFDAIWAKGSCSL